MKPALSLLALAATLLPCPADRPPALLTRETALLGLRAAGPDLRDPGAVFAAVFGQLPDTVAVQPTENYFYWQLYSDGREIRGNIRLSPDQRERGLLSFGYAEFAAFAGEGGPEPEVAASKILGAAEGVTVTCPGPLAATVSFRGKTVHFHLLDLPQLPPKQFPPGPDEQFVARTFDESGCGFFLLFNTRSRYFLWVLNEEEGAPDHFTPLGDNAVLGRRTGFVFYTRPGTRKVLAAVRRSSVRCNDWFDGPFDQLADNYADQTNIRKFMETARPALKGRIDKWGSRTDTPKPERVALDHYGTWESIAGAADFVARAAASGDPLRFIAQRGNP